MIPVAMLPYSFISTKNICFFFSMTRGPPQTSSCKEWNSLTDCLEASVTPCEEVLSLSCPVRYLILYLPPGLSYTNTEAFGGKNAAVTVGSGCCGP